MKELELCVFGQFNIDAVSSSLGNGSYFRLGHNQLRFGGTVANLAEHAKDKFAHVSAVFSVGNDLVGEMLRNRADDLFDAYVAIEVSEADSGLVLILLEEDGRLMVGPARGSSSFLTPESIDNECQKLFSKADVVVIDGYLLLGENGPDIICSALATAKLADTLTVIDLVPHDLPRYISEEIFAQIAVHADIIVGELRTIAPFFNIEEDALKVSQQLLALNPFLTAILRYGEHQISVNHIISAEFEMLEHHSGALEELTMFGYGDRLLVGQILNLLETRQ